MSKNEAFKKKRMKRFWFVVLLTCICLGGALVWENIYRNYSQEDSLKIFERNLHREELRVDKKLESLDLTKDLSKLKWEREKNVVLVAFQRGLLKYWSDKRVGTPSLYRQLKAGTNLVKINNVYYDVRKRIEGDIELFALLFLKDDYPYTNKYVTNYFNTSFGVDTDNNDGITIYSVYQEDIPSIHNREGQWLFQIKNDSTYKLIPPRFLLLLYLLCLCLLFYAYSLILDCPFSFSVRFLCMLGMLGILLFGRVLMMKYQIPYSLYTFPIFDHKSLGESMIFPVGDLFVTMFCVLYFMYVTLHKMRIEYTNPYLIRYRYLFLTVFVFLAFLYTNFLYYSVHSLIDNTQISLNIARFQNINFFSITAFVTLVLGAMGLIVLVSSSVRYFHHLFSLKEVVWGITLVLTCCVGLCVLSLFSITFLECLFIWILYFLFVLNVYWVRQDVQKSIYILALVVVSAYVIFVTREAEVHREMAVRTEYAAEMMQERDHMFEVRLKEMDRELKEALLLGTMVRTRNARMVDNLIFGNLADLMGFFYSGQVVLYDERSQMSIYKERVVQEGYNRYDELIRAEGKQLEGTNFYHIDRFDGLVTYLGCYVYPYPEGNVYLYLLFNSEMQNTGLGYTQVLARDRDEDKYVNRYPYAYAKYKDGVLLTSKGDYNYYKYLSQFGLRDYKHVNKVSRDGYSHAMIPVGESGMFVVSLNNDVFALYGVNILYAVFLSVIFSLGGIFFRFDKEKRIYLKRETLKRRIKNNFLVLMGILFLVLTVLAVYGNTRSVNRRHEMRVVELSRYVCKELERLDNIDMTYWLRLQNLLREMSNVLWVDINVFNSDGHLMATSQPLIFEKGFEGNLLSPTAYQRVVQDRAVSFVEREHIHKLNYMSAYMPLVLDGGKTYVLNIPYFMKDEELESDIMLLVIIFVNVTLFMMGLAFILSGLVAERITKPLQLVNDKLRFMQESGKNEKILYDKEDEVGELIKEYNVMVDKVDENRQLLTKLEREGAWREMARQIAHEIKNPLTPMKLNLQFLQKAVQGEDVQEIRRRFKDISAVLIEQIDHMSSIATAFSDFSKMSVANNELFCLSTLVENCVKLFEQNVCYLRREITPDVFIYGDSEQVNRMLINLLKNAEQSIPKERQGMIVVVLEVENGRAILSVQDNGVGIPKENQKRISEPNFTTKSGGTGLGLAMSYKIIRNMGGDIFFESEEGIGTVFHVVLEVAKQGK